MTAGATKTLDPFAYSQHHTPHPQPSTQTSLLHTHAPKPSPMHMPPYAHACPLTCTNSRTQSFSHGPTMHSTGADNSPADTECNLKAQLTLKFQWTVANAMSNCIQNCMKSHEHSNFYTMCECAVHGFSVNETR